MVLPAIPAKTISGDELLQAVHRVHAGEWSRGEGGEHGLLDHVADDVRVGLKIPFGTFSDVTERVES